jgi:CO dehydrogenase beta subunit/acetyl-CoA synthase epsilon subunit
LIDLGKTRRIPIIATGKTNRALLNKGYEHAAIMPAVEAGHRLSDREWKGPDGNGPYDLVILTGLPHHLERTILSGLSHSAPHIRALSLKLDGQYYPGLSTLPRIRGPCNWTSCVTPVQTYRSLVFRPETSRKPGVTARHREG